MVNDEEDETEVINPYEEVDHHNRPPPTSDKETEFAPPVVQIADADDVLIPPVIQLQALVNKKKVVITEAAIREVLRLDDAEGVDFLPNKEIFAELACMVYEKPSIKLTFYKAFSQVENSIFLSISLIAWRVGKGFSGVETSLFEGMLVERVIKEGEMMLKNQPYHLLLHHHNHLKIFHQHPSLLQEALDACAALTRRVKHLEYDKVAQALEITKLKRRRVDTSEDTVMDDASNQWRIIDEMDKDDGRQTESQAKIYKIDMDHALKVLSMQKDEPAKVQKVVDVVTTAKLITKVVTAASKTVIAASTIISTVEPQVPDATITVAPVRIVAAPSRRRKGVVIRDPEEESTTSLVIPADTKSKDKGKGIMVEEPKPLKKKQQVEMDEEYTRKLDTELNKDIDRDVAIEHVKQKAKEDPVVQRYQTKEQMEKEESRALHIINETPAHKAAKRRKLNEEVDDLKRHLEIMPDEGDDLYTEATPLARKVKWIKNGAKAGIYGFGAIKSAYFSTSRQSHEKSPSMPLDRPQKNKSDAAYTERFNKLALLCPDVVPNEKKNVELYIKGLPKIIKGETTSSRPATLNEAMCMAHTLMEQKIQEKNERIAEDIKKKWEKTIKATTITTTATTE
nr:reverse transcriptase domain-containing protein [Tanacetum cinerariifolium]